MKMLVRLHSPLEKTVKTIGMYATGLAFTIAPSLTFACLNAFVPRVSKLGVARIATFFEPGPAASTTSALARFLVSDAFYTRRNR